MIAYDFSGASAPDTSLREGYEAHNVQIQQSFIKTDLNTLQIKLWVANYTDLSQNLHKSDTLVLV